MTSILVPESSSQATSHVSKNESSAYDRFHRIDVLGMFASGCDGEALGALTEKLHLRCAEPDEVHWRDRNRPVDAEDRNLELVARLDCVRQDDAIRYVETLDGGWAGIAAAARHVPVDPDFRVVVDIGREHGLCVRRFETAD